MTRLVGLYREPECSPGRHLSNDACLLEQIGDGLRQRGAEIRLISFDETSASCPDASLIFSMCQGRRSLLTLHEWERGGAGIVNSPAAALNTHRDHLPQLLYAAGVPFPATRLMACASADAQALPFDGPHWLKRGDVHASVPGDVQRVETCDALARGLAEFRARGIEHAALQEHRDGAEIKFYGVAGAAFFHWYFTNDLGAAAPPTSALQQLAERAARAAGLDIFGGDIIVEPSGALTLIDLNDWPSFAPCRDAASEAIADFLMRRVHDGWNAGLVSSANESAI